MDRRSDSLTPLALTPKQRDAAQQAWRAAAALLSNGVQSAGLGQTGELLRAMHSARIAGLPRLAASGTRVAQHVRALHYRRPEFGMASLTWDSYQLLATAHALHGAATTVDPAWIGAARRPYSEVGTLRLYGLYSAPVVSAGGYVGAETLLLDEQRQVWSLSNVSPGDAFDCQFAYVAPFEFGGVTLDHRALSRAGLVVEHATAAGNRRLGSGRSVLSTLTEGALWWEPPLAALWDVPLATQVDRAFLARAAEDRQAGDDLLFARCRVVGAAGDAVRLAAGATVLSGIAPSAHAELAYRRNLVVISRLAGLEVWIVGRIAFGRPRTLQLLAVGGPDLPLPGEWLGRSNLGFDTLDVMPLADLVTPPPEADTPAIDPLAPLKRRLEQILLGGRATVSPITWAGFAQDQATLARNHMPTAAALLATLRDAAPDRDRLATTWLAAQTYATAAETTLQRAAWLT